MIAEIVSVGTELLLGEIVDTNAAYLAAELRDHSLATYHRQTVGDNLERIAAAIELALSRSDLILLGGGLGPTDDDLTREAVAKVFGKTPQVDPVLLERLEELYRSRGRNSMPRSNLKQAWRIEGAEILDNPIGTAPGWWCARGSQLVVALPGPPAELRRMWREQVLPRLPVGGALFRHVTLHTFGVGESQIADLLGELTQRGNPSVATYARRHGVDVRVAAQGATPEAALAAITPALEQVRQILGSYSYGEDDQTLAGAALGELRRLGQTVATLESVSGGWIASQLTDVPGASAAFVGGAVSYQTRSKLIFQVTPYTLSQHGAVSAETAAEMARGIRETLGSDWGVGTTGVAGPSPFEGHPPGLAYVAVAGPGGMVRTKTLNWPGEREQIKERVAGNALMLLFEELRGR